MSPGRLIDVSDAQHKGLPPGKGPPIDWIAVAEAGVTGLFLKATQGTFYVNEWLEIDHAGAQAAGIDVICYHFAAMGDPFAEAQWFLRYAGPYARMLDFETNTNVQWARTFLLELALPRGELITYGSASTLKDFYAQLPSMAFPAAYNQGWPGWGVCWQFTDASTIPGIPTAVDEDQWRGDESQFETLFMVNAEPAPLPGIPKGDGMWGTVIEEDGVQKVLIYTAGLGNSTNHLLEWTRTPPSQANSVIDMTNQVGLNANNGGPFLVQP